MEWNLFNKHKPETYPKEAGWYAAAVDPANFSELKELDRNSWRQSFGFTKCWFNPMSRGLWYEPDANGHGSKEIVERVTHWGKLPDVPLYPFLPTGDDQ